MEEVALIGGLGLVGKEVFSLLKSSKYAPKKIKLITRESKYDFDNLDVVFICTPSNVARLITPLAIKKGAKVIDLSSAHRHADYATLYHPSIKQDLDTPLISIPNCVVSIMMTVLAPLDDITPIKRLFVSTYQAASGAGKKGMAELLENKTPDVFPHPYANNLFIHEKHEGEEEKIIEETKRLLHKPDLPMGARCIRVPVVRAHSMVVNVTFEEELLPQAAFEILQKESALKFLRSPTPKIAENQHEVFYGPIRKDNSLPNTLDLFICGDQLLRGAALTAVECYDFMCSGGILT